MPLLSTAGHINGPGPAAQSDGHTSTLPTCRPAILLILDSPPVPRAESTTVVNDAAAGAHSAPAKAAPTARPPASLPGPSPQPQLPAASAARAPPQLRPPGAAAPPSAAAAAAAAMDAALAAGPQCSLPPLDPWFVGRSADMQTLLDLLVPGYASGMPGRSGSNSGAASGFGAAAAQRQPLGGGGQGQGRGGAGGVGGRGEELLLVEEEPSGPTVCVVAESGAGGGGWAAWCWWIHGGDGMAVQCVTHHATSAHPSVRSPRLHFSQPTVRAPRPCACCPPPPLLPLSTAPQAWARRPWRWPWGTGCLIWGRCPGARCRWS